MKKILLIIFMIVSIFSCSDKSENVRSLNFSLGQEGKSIDPQLGISYPTLILHGVISEGLTKLDKDFNIVLGLAKSYEVSDDGLVYTFYLKDNIKWSNGDDITSNDFKFAWLRGLDPKVAADYAAYLLFSIKNAKEYNAGNAKREDVGIEIIDDKTFKVTLENVTPYFDSLVSFPTFFPINEKFYNEFGEKYALEPENMIYSGEYVIESWEHNSSMKLVKNKYYYNQDNIKLDEINFLFMGDSNSELNAFKNEELDLIRLDEAQVQEFKDDPRLEQFNQAYAIFLKFNEQIPVLNNSKIRKALLLSLDKDNMEKTIFNGINKAAYTFTPRNVGIKGIKDDFSEEVGDIVPKFNKEEAIKLLKEGMEELNIKEFPKLTLTLSDRGLDKSLSEAIQESFRVNLGINIDINIVTYKERITNVSSQNYDIALVTWGADYKDPLTYLDLFVTNGGNNNTGYSNLEYDELIEYVRSENNKEKRIDALRKIEEIIARDLPIAPLFVAKRSYLVSPKLKGVILSPIGTEVLLMHAEKID